MIDISEYLSLVVVDGKIVSYIKIAKKEDFEEDEKN